MVCDESSILKNFDGMRRALITEFMRKLPYRLLCTATAAPNDYIELGTSVRGARLAGPHGHAHSVLQERSEHKRHDGHRDSDASDSGDLRAAATDWRFKGHAERPFWRWVCSWARLLRRPSDLGFDDEGSSCRR